MKLARFSLGVGDRFACEAPAQLKALQQARSRGLSVIPVWNKSNREHLIVGSEPDGVRRAADEAVRAMGWDLPYHVDADHIGLKTVDRFLAVSDFFTIDVADFIGSPWENGEIEAFLDRHPELAGRLEIEGVERPLSVTEEQVAGMVSKYGLAVREAGKVYRHIASVNGDAAFIPEISMDETDAPQTPPELLAILALIADEGIPVQTIAPKFTGRFNKGVDYVGDVAQFEREFGEDLAVIAHAVRQYGLPENLKLSVHSGSDKFSIYGPIRRALQRTGAGLHLKTAGTTWLEEVIGLAEADGEGLVLARDLYEAALEHVDELCAPYAAVIDIDRSKLPMSEAVRAWTSEQYVRALRHEPTDPLFNPHLRQLLHVGYKVAAQMKSRFLALLEGCRESVGRNVTANLYERHILPLFPGE